MKYIIKKNKIYEVNDSYNTRKIKYNTYNSALGIIAKKKISKVTNRINNDIVPELINTYRYIYSLPDKYRERYAKELESKIGSLAYKRKAKKLGKIQLVNLCKDESELSWNNVVKKLILFHFILLSQNNLFFIVWYIDISYLLC